MQHIYPRHTIALRKAVKLLRGCGRPRNMSCKEWDKLLTDADDAMSVIRDIARTQHILRNGVPHCTEEHLRKALVMGD